MKFAIGVIAGIITLAIAKEAGLSLWLSFGACCVITFIVRGILDAAWRD